MKNGAEETTQTYTKVTSGNLYLCRKMCCKLACISVFLHKLVYRVAVAIHLEEDAGEY